ncbi:hypothetical protein [Pikeienuella sp. HZG-20]|uniref:hypothetical protein n=1 Tax=Paludibacillus litoralis TaxID=3133267 RepID=UPI0030EC512F
MATEARRLHRWRTARTVERPPSGVCSTTSFKGGIWLRRIAANPYFDEEPFNAAPTAETAGLSG